MAIVSFEAIVSLKAIGVNVQFESTFLAQKPQKVSKKKA